MHDRIAARFSQAAGRYEQGAMMQRIAAQRFDEWLAEQGLAAPASIAEIGCGTGMFTRLLHERHPQASLLATDLAPAMVEACRARLPPSPQLRFGVCDGRDARFDPAPDWIVSAMCFQWFAPLLPVLKHHFSQARVLAFSLVLDGSFAAWHAAHQAAGMTAGLQAFPEYQGLLEACEALGAARVRAGRISLSEDHQNGLAFAHGLRTIGADQPRPGHVPIGLRPVLRRLQDGFTVNYEIGFFCLEA